MLVIPKNNLFQGRKHVRLECNNVVRNSGDLQCVVLIFEFFENKPALFNGRQRFLLEKSPQYLEIIHHDPTR